MYSNVYKQVDINSGAFSLFERKGMCAPLVVCPFLDSERRDDLPKGNVEGSILAPYYEMKHNEPLDYYYIHQLIDHGRVKSRVPKLSIVDWAPGDEYGSTYLCRFASGVVCCEFTLSMEPVFTADREACGGTDYSYMLLRNGSNPIIEVRCDYEREVDSFYITERDWFEYCDVDVNIHNSEKITFLTKSLLIDVLKITFGEATLPLEVDILSEFHRKFADIA